MISTGKGAVNKTNINFIQGTRNISHEDNLNKHIQQHVRRHWSTKLISLS